MAQKLGLDAVLNVQSDGVSGTDGWVGVDEVQDLEVDVNKGKADNTTRANNGWRSYKGTLKECTVTFKMPYDPANANFLLIKNAFLTNTHLGFQVYDGSVNPGGIVADFDITKFTIGQNLEDVQSVSVEMDVTFVDTSPAWTDPA